MAKFQIATPGGYEVEITANSEQEAIAKAQSSWQTLPKIIHKGPDNLRVFEDTKGRRYAVSKGYSTSDPAQIDRLMKGTTPERLTQQSRNEALIEAYPVGARSQEFVRGVPFAGSYIDELAGATLGPQAQQRSRELTTAMQTERPGETLGLNLAGGVASGVGAAAAAPGAAPVVLGQGARWMQAARGAGTMAGLGGLEGGVYGAGEGTEGNRAESAAIGAGTGAAFGAGFGAAAPYAKQALGNVASVFKRSDIATIASTFGISKEAAKVIKTTFDQGGDINYAISNLQRAGDSGMVADAGPAAQALLDAANQFGGEAGTTVRREIGQRMSDTNRQLGQTLDTQLGEAPLGPRTAVERIAAGYRDDLNDLYNTAYSTPIDYTTGAAGDNVLATLKRIAKADPEAFGQAVRSANLQAAGDPSLNQYKQINAIIDDKGNVTFEELPNLVQLDMLKRGLQSVAYKNVDEFGRLNAEGKVYAKLAADLRGSMIDAVPSYEQAVRLGGDKLADERAFTLGRNLLRAGTELEDVMSELGSNASQTQVDAAKLGLRSYIDKALGDVRAIASDPNVDALEARQVIKAVTDMSSDNARAKIRAVIGPEADALLSKVDEAAQSATVSAAMARNSATAARLAQKETIEQVTAPGMGGQLAQGELVNTTKDLVKIATGQTNEYTAAQRQRVYNDIAKALTEKRGPDAEVALRALDAAMRGKELSDRQAETLAQYIVNAMAVTSTALPHGAATEERQ